MSQLTNPFYLPVDHYQRDMDIIPGYLDDNALYLSLMTGKPYTECEEFVKQTVRPDGTHPFKNPDALVLEKTPNGDRAPKTMSFLGFIERVQKNKLLLSPSMAAYMPEEQRESTHAIYIKEAVARRKVAKGQQLQAERQNDKETALVKKGEQNNLKINNNSYSGGTVSTATILYYKSTHSSLTSTCRTATSYANANNEKFITGNRHYYSPEITKANLLFICNNTDLVFLANVMHQHNLHYPTPEEVVDMVRHSTPTYWTAVKHFEDITKMATNMTPVQRAAVMYVGDFYQLYQHNPDFIKNFLFELSALGDPVTQATSDDEYKAFGDDVELLANFLCFEQAKGRDKKQLLEGDDKQDPPLAPEPEVFELIKATGRNAILVLHKYSNFIKAFLMTKIMPASIHAFPTIYRKAAVISDTDSTMFTLQYWVNELFGRVCFTPEAKRVVFSLVFLISEVVMHLLAQQSANMGVSKPKLRLLAMKNEYYFAILALTTRSKHYFASQDAQEGIMFQMERLEVKGVGLRDSKVPPIINKAAKTMFTEIIGKIKNEESLDIQDILMRIGDLERTIKHSVQSGSFEYMTTGQVKAKESYKSDDNPTYKQYEMWQAVFAPFLGHTKEPPYSVVKVSLDIGNKTDLDNWCNRMDNPALATALKAYMLEARKKDLTTLMIPYTVVETSGVPREIIAGIDLRRMIANTMGTFYVLLETLGIFLIDKNNVRLVSDYY
jgi:hypothetical protein